ncbi:hypothetical protein [Jeotgalibacillus campisalis]|uniref:Uncharacterized protein n=1 Tax=Jeotgalibacillus campisalis TaxID=220754 RepID=A0A0C2VGW4_9BACL|nr:hypothetical protein [Jeotgalibacillus campisalis]KIL43253.1 hypothetical protein KR50_36560 [Jeotgalibacillus campisalis]
MAATKKKQGVFGNASKKSRMILGILLVLTAITMNALRIFNQTVSEFREDQTLAYALIHLACYGITYAIWRIFFYRI